MKKKTNVLKIIEKGKELWDQHGDTVIGVVKKIQSNVSKKSTDEKDGSSKPSEKGKLDLSKVSNIVSSAAGLYSEVTNVTASVPEDEASALPTESDPAEDIMVLDNDNDMEMAEVVEDDDFFHSSMDKLSDSLANAAESGFTDPKAVAAALSALTEVATDTVKYVADQETKQEEIRAQRDVAIAKINATTACIKEYLDKTFDERSAIFAKQFECVDVALRTGNNEMLAMSLNSINSLAASSPFKNLADINQVQQALGDGETEWDI